MCVCVWVDGRNVRVVSRGKWRSWYEVNYICDCICPPTLHLLDDLLDDLQEYLTTLEQNILGLANHLEQTSRRKNTTERTGHWIRAISESEVMDTYLRTAASDLARMCEVMEGHHADSDETLFIQNLQSIADYVRTAQVCGLEVVGVKGEEGVGGKGGGGGGGGGGGDDASVFRVAVSVCGDKIMYCNVFPHACRTC